MIKHSRTAVPETHSKIIQYNGITVINHKQGEILNALDSE